MLWGLVTAISYNQLCIDFVATSIVSRFGIVDHKITRVELIQWSLVSSLDVAMASKAPMAIGICGV